MICRRTTYPSARLVSLDRINEPPAFSGTFTFTVTSTFTWDDVAFSIWHSGPFTLVEQGEAP